MTAVSFSIPGPPQGKARARTGRGNHHYTPGKTVAYEQEIALGARLAMRGRPPIEGPVSLSFRAVFQIPASASKAKRKAMIDGLILPVKVPDLDNIMKAIGDGANGIVFRDDCQIVRLGQVEKVFGLTPGLTVSIDRITETARAA